MSNSSGSNKPPIENWGISDEYLILDSFEKLESSNTRQGEMVFNLGIKYPTSNQVTGINNDLTNIIEFEIGSFYMPPIPLLPYITNDNVDPVTLVLGPVPDRTLPRLIINTSDIVQTGNNFGQANSMACYGGRLGIEIKESNDQSIIGLSGTRMHFEMQGKVSEYGNNIVANPLSTPWGKYTFTEPILNLSKLTVTIKNPDVGIFLAPDVLYNVTPTIVASNKGYPILAFRITKQNHNIAVGDRIVIRTTDFTHGEGEYFKYIDKYINKAEGHIVGMEGTIVSDPNYIMDSVITPTLIRTNPEINLYDIVNTVYKTVPDPNSPDPNNPNYIQVPKYGIGTNLISSTRVNIGIAKNRIRIPLKVRKIIKGRMTNYKGA
jgi:hypothetical protein